MFYTLRVQTREAAFDRTIIRIERSRRSRARRARPPRAIAQLEKLAEAKLEDAESPLMVSYKEKLMLLDDAIAECEANIDKPTERAPPQATAGHVLGKTADAPGRVERGPRCFEPVIFARSPRSC